LSSAEHLLVVRAHHLVRRTGYAFNNDLLIAASTGGPIRFSAARTESRRLIAGANNASAVGQLIVTALDGLHRHIMHCAASLELWRPDRAPGDLPYCRGRRWESNRDFFALRQFPRTTVHPISPPRRQRRATCWLHLEDPPQGSQPRSRFRCSTTDDPIAGWPASKLLRAPSAVRRPPVMRDLLAFDETTVTIRPDFFHDRQRPSSPPRHSALRPPVCRDVSQTAHEIQPPPPISPVTLVSSMSHLRHRQPSPAALDSARATV